MHGTINIKCITVCYTLVQTMIARTKMMNKSTIESCLAQKYTVIRKKKWSKHFVFACYRPVILLPPKLCVPKCFFLIFMLTAPILASYRISVYFDRVHITTNIFSHIIYLKFMINIELSRKGPYGCAL